MSQTIQTAKFINNLFAYRNEDYRKCANIGFWTLTDIVDNKWAFFVHEAIVNSWVEMMPIYFKNPKWNIFVYELNIDKNIYNMAIIYIILQDNEEVDILRGIIHSSQFSFPWTSDTSLFIDLDSFDILQDFINKYKLNDDIDTIFEMPGISENRDQRIKTVKFNPSMNKEDTIDKFEKFLSSTKEYERPQYYFMVNAFPWLQPNEIDIFNITLYDGYNLVLVTILKYLGSLKNNNELNLLDLLSIRMAICDFREPSPSDTIQNELNFMIERELDKIVTNNHMNLEQYFISTNCQQRDLIIGYFVYEFQNFFETVKIDLDNFFGYEFTSTKQVLGTIKLDKEHNVLATIKQNDKVQYHVDGQGYENMSLYLFLDLLECQNVYHITLDTNHEWHQNECNLNRIISNPDGLIMIDLFGHNVYDFVESVISAIKSITVAETTNIYIRINCYLTDYTIFDTSNVSEFSLIDVEITTDVLLAISKCCLAPTTLIDICNCTFQNYHVNFEILFYLKQLGAVSIIEDENIWPTLFDFIAHEMDKLNCSYFKFKPLVCIKSLGMDISLNEFAFTVDKQNYKLEMRELSTGKTIDLHDLKFPDQSPDDNIMYDFQQ